MRKKGKTTRTRKIVDLCIYCTGVCLLFFSVVLFLLEFQYIPEETYQDPPPARPTEMEAVVQPTAAVPTADIVQPDTTATPTAAPTAATEVTRAPQAESTPKAEETPIIDENSLQPIKLYFIDQEVSCKVRPVGLTDSYKMGTIRSAYDAGWLAVSPYVVPGEIGTAVIAGHNRWGGKTGTFSVLKKMKVGETVAVELNDGYARYFVVDEIGECSYNDNTIMNTVSDRAVLVLVTCKGDWSDALHTSKTRVYAICSPVE